MARQCWLAVRPPRGALPHDGHREPAVAAAAGDARRACGDPPHGGRREGVPALPIRLLRRDLGIHPYHRHRRHHGPPDVVRELPLAPHRPLPMLAVEPGDEPKPTPTPTPTLPITHALTPTLTPLPMLAVEPGVGWRLPWLQGGGALGAGDVRLPRLV